MTGTAAAAAVPFNDLMASDPLELRNRTHSMGTHEIAQGSWAVGSIPKHRESVLDSAKAQRKSSMQLGLTDSTALRNALRNPGHTFNVEAVAGTAFSQYL